MHELPPRDDRQLESGRYEALTDVRLGEVDAGLGREHCAEERSVEALEVVARALGLAAVLEGDDDAVARADLTLELRLGFRNRTRRRGGCLRADREHALVGRRRAQAEHRALLQRRRDVHVEAPRIVGVHRGRHVLPVRAERRLDLLVGRGDERDIGSDQVEWRPERVHRQVLDRTAALLGVFEGCLGEHPVLGGKLGRGRQLQLLGVAQRALRERREPADRLDLVAEELEPRSTVLRGAEDVQDPSAERELPTRLDLIDAFIPRFGQELGAEGEVDLFSDPERKTLGPKRRVRHRLGQGDRARDNHRRLAGVRRGRQRVECGDAKADEMGRRRNMRGVSRAPGRVVADAAWRQVGAELTRQVAGGHIVRGDDHDRAVRPGRRSSSASAAIRYGWMEPEA